MLQLNIPWKKEVTGTDFNLAFIRLAFLIDLVLLVANACLPILLKLKTLQCVLFGPPFISSTHNAKFEWLSLHLQSGLNVVFFEILNVNFSSLFYSKKRNMLVNIDKKRNFQKQNYAYTEGRKRRHSPAWYAGRIFL